MKLKNFASVTVITQLVSSSDPQKFAYKFNNQALSWLRTYWLEEILCWWIALLDQYEDIQKWRRIQHVNADGLCNKSNQCKLSSQGNCSIGKQKRLIQIPFCGARRPNTLCPKKEGMRDLAHKTKSWLQPGCLKVLRASYSKNCKNAQQVQQQPRSPALSTSDLGLTNHKWNRGRTVVSNTSRSIAYWTFKKRFNVTEKFTNQKHPQTFIGSSNFKEH